MLGRFLKQANRMTPLARTFAEANIEHAKTGGSGSVQIRQYKNGNLVTRSTIALKKTEDIQGFVINIFKDYFRTTNKEGVTLSSTLEDHGLDSLDAIELSMRVEEELGYLISAETLPVLRSVQHYVNYISQVESFKERTKRNPLA